MAYPSGTFARSSSGLLRATFSARYASYQGDFGTGASDIRIACVIKNAANAVVAQAVLSRSAASLPLTVNYPGNGEAYTVQMSYIDHSIAGAGWVRADNLSIYCELLKR